MPISYLLIASRSVPRGVQDASHPHNWRRRPCTANSTRHPPLPHGGVGFCKGGGAAAARAAPRRQEYTRGQRWPRGGAAVLKNNHPTLFSQWGYNIHRAPRRGAPPVGSVGGACRAGVPLLRHVHAVRPKTARPHTPRPRRQRRHHSLTDRHRLGRLGSPHRTATPPPALFFQSAAAAPPTSASSTLLHGDGGE